MKNFLIRLFKKPEPIEYEVHVSLCLTQCPHDNPCSVNSHSCTKCDKYRGVDKKKQIVYCTGGIK